MSSNRMPPKGGPKGMPPKKLDKGVFKRVIKLLFKSYPVLAPLTCVCILLSALVSSIPAVFQQKVLKIVTEYYEAGNLDWTAAKTEILPMVGMLLVLYLFSIIFITTHSQLMAYITQGFLDKMRCKMFDGMQNLPIKYFDTHKHGDIMSYYTNDIDPLRQLVSQSLPSLLRAGSVLIGVFFVMLYFSVWMTALLLVGVVIMVFVGPVIAVLLSVIGWLGLLGAAPFSVAYIVRACKEGVHGKALSVFAAIFQFFFSLDVIFVIILAIKDRVYSKQQKRQYMQ